MSYLGDKDFLIEVAKGNVAGHELVHKFGSIDNLGSTMTPVCTSGTYPTPTAAVSLEMVSSSINDDVAGTGALSVRVFGLDANWAVQEQDVTLTGTVAAAVPGTWLRVYRLKVTGSGTYGSPAAASHNSTINLQVSGGGAIWATIETHGGFGLGQSEIGAFSVPTGQSAYLLHATAKSEGNKPSLVMFYVREAADTVSAPFSAMQVKVLNHNLDGGESYAWESPLGPFVGPCDMGWMGSAATGTPDVEATFELLCRAD